MSLSVSRPYTVAMIVGFAFLMQNLDGTIIATALPQMSLTFATTPVHLSIVIVAYLLSLAVFVPMSGRIADRFGACTVFRIAIAIFTLGSLLCGISNSVAELTASRVLQGMGGALMTPVGQLILLRSTQRSEFVRAMTYLTMLSQIGTFLGPPLGGFIATFASWRWIFLMNLPFGVLGILLATRFVEDFREGKKVPLDWIGFVLNGITLSCLTYGLEALGRGTASPTEVVACLGAGTLVAPFAIWHARRAAYPQIDFSLLRIPTFRVNFSGGSLFRVGASSIPFLLPLLFQSVFGMDAFHSGMLSSATAVGAMTVRLVGPPMLRRFGFRGLLTRNELIGVTLIVLCTFIRAETPVPVILVLLYFLGLSHSLQYTSLNTLSYADVAPPKISAATSFGALGNQVVNGFSVAIAATVLNLSLFQRGAEQLTEVDLQLALSVVAAISILSLLFFSAVAPGVGADFSRPVEE